MILRRSQTAPDDIALDDLTRRRTWSELEDRTVRMSRWLRDDVGLGAGDHAAVVSSNRVDCVELLLAAILAGVWLTPANNHLTADELGYVLEDSGSRVVVTDVEHEAVVRNAASGCDVVTMARLDACLAGVSDEPLSLESAPGAAMVYTSGTTGRPRGVRRVRQATVRAALESMGTSGARLGLDGRGPHLVTGPLYHAAPLLFAVYDMINGAPVVVMPRWNEASCLELIRDRRVTTTHLVPTMFVRLLRLPDVDRDNADVSSLGLVLHGAAPIAPSVKAAMIDWWGPVLVEYWGATEGGVYTLVSSPDWLDRPGTVGRPLPTFDVFAVDDSGHRLPARETGRLYCAHRSVDQPFVYHHAPEKTAGAYLDDRTFTAGDVGWVDEDGWVYLADRASNMIISGGVNIYPAEIEAVLHDHPAVADVAVFGVPDDEWGETVRAAIELRDGFEPGDRLRAEITNFAREHLASYKLPREIDFHESLPRHDTGKLAVRRLRDPFWEGRARRI